MQQQQWFVVNMFVLTSLPWGVDWMFIAKLRSSSTHCGISPNAPGRHGTRRGLARRTTVTSHVAIMRHGDHVDESGIARVAKSGQWEKALVLLQALEVSNVKAKCRTCSAIINVCQKVSNWILALELFEHLDGYDMISFSLAMNACVKGLQWTRALVLLDTLEELGLQGECMYKVLRKALCVSVSYM